MHEVVPDREMTQDEVALVAALSREQLFEIDDIILSHVHKKYSRKVAFLVGSTMSDLPNREKGIPDVFYLQRVALLVDRGLLVAEGDLECMRHCEVRFP